MLNAKTDDMFFTTLCTWLHRNIYTLGGRHKNENRGGQICIICNFIIVFVITIVL